MQTVLTATRPTRTRYPTNPPPLLKTSPLHIFGFSPTQPRDPRAVPERNPHVEQDFRIPGTSRSWDLDYGLVFSTDESGTGPGLSWKRAFLLRSGGSVTACSWPPTITTESLSLIHKAATFWKSHCSVVRHFLERTRRSHSITASWGIRCTLAKSPPSRSPTGRRGYRQRRI